MSQQSFKAAESYDGPALGWSVYIWRCRDGRFSSGIIATGFPYKHDALCAVVGINAGDLSGYEDTILRALLSWEETGA